MSRTRHHGRARGAPDWEHAHKRRAPGYEYWGRDANIGSDQRTIAKSRRMRNKRDARLAEETQHDDV